MKHGPRSLLLVGPFFGHCDFAPSPAERLAGYARYLPDHGWRTVVVAPACRCTVADHGPPPPGGVAGARDALVFDPSDTLAMDAVRERVAAFGAGEAVHLALRPVLSAPPAFRAWAARFDERGADEVRVKMSWHLTPGFDPVFGGARGADGVVRSAIGAYVRASGHQSARARMLARTAASAISAGTRYDAVLGSHGYAPELRAAARAAAAAQLPFVAEMRDALTRGWMPLYEAIELRRVFRAVRGADAVLHCSQIEQDRDAWWLGSRPERRVIEHGFDPDEWARIRATAAPTGEPFTLRFFGTLHPRRHLGRFLESLGVFLAGLGPNDRNRVVFEYYGLSSGLMSDLAGRAPQDVGDRVRVVGHVPRAEAVRLMAEASVLVLPTSRGLPGGRFYEYLGSGRPILATGDEWDPYVAEALRRTRAGEAVASAEEGARALRRWWDAWKAGSLRPDVDAAALEHFTRRRQAADLANLLDELSARAAREPTTA